MSDVIVVALVSGGLTLIGTIITVVWSNKATTAVMNEKIETLSKRVERHNQVVERTYKLEQECAVLDEKIKVANNRINNLEGDAKHD